MLSLPRSFHLKDRCEMERPDRFSPPALIAAQLPEMSRRYRMKQAEQNHARDCRLL